MSKYVKLAEETGDRYLAALEKGQENFLKYVAAMNQWAPRPVGPMPDLAALRAFTNASFDFSERYLQQQKAFSNQFFGQEAKSAKSSPKPVPAKASPAPKPAPVARKKSSKKTSTRTRKASAAKSSSTAKAPAVTSSKKKASARSKPASADKS